MSTATKLIYTHGVTATGNDCIPWGVYRFWESDEYPHAELVESFVRKEDAQRKLSTLRNYWTRPLLTRRSNRP